MQSDGKNSLKALWKFDFIINTIDPYAQDNLDSQAYIKRGQHGAAFVHGEWLTDLTGPIS